MVSPSEDVKGFLQKLAKLFNIFQFFQFMWFVLKPWSQERDVPNKEQQSIIDLAKLAHFKLKKYYVVFF